MTLDEERSDPRERRLGWAAVAVCTACGVLAALIESMLVPLYFGRVLVPIAVVLAIASNIGLPLLARQAVDRTIAAVAPFGGWLLVILVLNGLPRPEGDVIYPGGDGYLPWVSYGVILGGAVAGTITIVASSPAPATKPRPSARTERPATK